MVPPPLLQRLGAQSLRLCANPSVATGAQALLILGLIGLNPGLPMLRGTDAAVYAQVAKEMLERPLGMWPMVTLDGAPFHEHPPGLMYLMAAAFWAFGPSVGTALGVAHSLTTLLVLLCVVCARRVAGPCAGVGALFGLSVQSGFWAEAHNPMLELPTATGLLLGMTGLVVAAAPRGRGARWQRGLGATAALAGPVAAAWSKGPVAAVWLPLVLTLAALGLCSWRRAMANLVLTGALCGASFWLFDVARARLGLPSFFWAYGRQQLWPSMVEGRHHPVASYFYYLPLLWRWYAAGMLLLALAGAAVAWASRRRPRAWRLYGLGLVWLLTVVLGFSAMRQKYQWYLHAALPAWAFITGGGLAALPSRWRMRLCQGLTVAACVAAALGTGLWRVRPELLAPRQPICLAALHRLPPEVRPLGAPKRRLACCVGAAGWRERYVALFVLDAELVPCGAPCDETLTPAGWRPGALPGEVEPAAPVVPPYPDATNATPRPSVEPARAGHAPLP